MAKKFNIKRTQWFHDYYSRLKSIALSLFKWNGLPQTCNERFLEDCLFHYGTAILINDEDMGYLNLKSTIYGDLNVYNEPLHYQAFSTGYSKVFHRDNCVLIRNNYLEKSTDSTIMLYAERLALLEMAIQININAQKTPLLLRGEEKIIASLKALYNNYEGDEPVIILSSKGSFNEKPIECIKTDAPFVADKLREEKRAVWNEALEYMGLNTNPSDKKKERLIVSEVDSNNEQIDIQGCTMLLTREKACEDAKRIFNLDLSVEFRIDELKKHYIPNRNEVQNVG